MVTAGTARNLLLPRHGRPLERLWTFKAPAGSVLAPPDVWSALGAVLAVATHDRHVKVNETDRQSRRVRRLHEALSKLLVAVAVAFPVGRIVAQAVLARPWGHGVGAVVVIAAASVGGPPRAQVVKVVGNITRSAPFRSYEEENMSCVVCLHFQFLTGASPFYLGR